MRQLLAIALFAAGCGASSDPPGGGSGGPAADASRTDAACPLAIDRTTSAIEDTVDGVVVEFTTPSPANLPALRMRVDALARAHERESRAGAGGRVASVAAVEKAGPDDGVRLVLRPRDPAQVDAVRAALRERADDLVKRHCEVSEPEPD